MKPFLTNVERPVLGFQKKTVSTVDIGWIGFVFSSSNLDVFSRFFFCSFLEKRPVNLCVLGKESN